MRRLLWLLLLALAGLPAVVHAAPPVGFDVVSPRCCERMGYDEVIDVAGRFPLVKIQMPEAFWTDPVDVQALIDRGARVVILRTADGPAGYDPDAIRWDFTRPGGVSGLSYADVVTHNPHVQFWLEIGNEPNLAGVSAWDARWSALHAYKQLALRENWRQRYPNLRWAVSLPTDLPGALLVTTWMDLPGDVDGDGGVLDYYDAVGVHLYGWHTIEDGGGGDWLRILDAMLANPWCRGLLITELGIDDPHTSDLVKAMRYRAFVDRLPDRVLGVAVFTVGAGGGTGFERYELDDGAAIRTLAGQ